jgi:hypothetical protein
MQKRPLTKIQHPFMMNALKKLRIEGTYLDVIKVTYEKQKSYYMRKHKSISPKIRN